jgi:hypothetical protein
MGPLPPLAPPTLIRGAGALMLGVGALMLAQPTSFWGSRTRGGRLVRRTPSPPGAVWELVALPRRSVLCGVSCAWCVRPAHGGVGGPPAAAAGAAASERAARAAPHRPAARARETPKKVRTSSVYVPGHYCRTAVGSYKVQQLRATARSQWLARISVGFGDSDPFPNRFSKRSAPTKFMR